MFGNDAKHFLNTINFFLSRFGCTITFFNLEILWGKVCWHGYLMAWALATIIIVEALVSATFLFLDGALSLNLDDQLMDPIQPRSQVIRR